MQVALDESGNRIYATTEAKKTRCFCQLCGQPVTPRIGKIKAPHFAHKPDSDCPYPTLYDKNYKTDWHIRMQGYFPEKAREVIFEDKKTGEKHIADIFLSEADMVIEFQHSPIDTDEFVRRTHFHISNGRQIVWVFDESKEGENCGRFSLPDVGIDQWPYRELMWKHNPRRCLLSIQNLQSIGDKVAVFVAPSKENDLIYRMVRQFNGYKSVWLSFHPYDLQKLSDPKALFLTDEFWIAQEPYKSAAEEYRRRVKARSTGPTYIIQPKTSMRKTHF